MGPPLYRLILRIIGSSLPVIGSRDLFKNGGRRSGRNMTAENYAGNQILWVHSDFKECLHVQLSHRERCKNQILVCIVCRVRGRVNNYYRGYAQ